MAYNYPYGNGQQLNLDWFLAEWKNLLAAWEAEKNGIDGALQAEIDRAEAALADVFAARDAAAQSAANALESKNAAAQSASDASGYLDSVEQNATAARNAAQNAAQSESNAAESAQTALASKNTAANSERNAAQSEANALASKNAAAQSAADALAHKDAAAQSAADALANKNAAAQSAEDAEDAAASVEASAQQITTNTNDISDLKELIANTSPAIIVSKSGTVVAFSDGTENKDIENIQIDNNATWLTVANSNLLRAPSASTHSENGLNFTFNDDGGITITGTSTATTNCYLLSINEGDIYYLNSGDYILKTSDNVIPGCFMQIIVANLDGTDVDYINNFNVIQKAFTITQAKIVRAIVITISANITLNNTIKPQLNINAVQPFEKPLYTDYAPTDNIKTRKGNNVIFANTGSISLDYQADTKLYIDNAIANLQATMLENIGG